MRQCKTCRWRDRCDLDCGDPQGFSYEPDMEERGESEERGEDDHENKEDN